MHSYQYIHFGNLLAFGKIHMELKCGIPVYMYLNNLMNVSLAVVNDF